MLRIKTKIPSLSLKDPVGGVKRSPADTMKAMVQTDLGVSPGTTMIADIGPMVVIHGVIEIETADVTGATDEILEMPPEGTAVKTTTTKMIMTTAGLPVVAAGRRTALTCIT